MGISWLLTHRAFAEVAAAGVLCAAFIGWWQLHNHAEQKIGATQCIISTTEVKAEAVQDDSAIEAAHAAQLAQVVAVYEQKLADSAGANATLAGRLRDYAVRQIPAAGAGCPATRGAAVGRLSASEGPTAARPDAVTADIAAVLDACDADHAKVILVNAAYNDWRARMIVAGRAAAP